MAHHPVTYAKVPRKPESIGPWAAHALPGFPLSREVTE
jgi:hypothetical protein